MVVSLNSRLEINKEEEVNLVDRDRDAATRARLDDQRHRPRPPRGPHRHHLFRFNLSSMKNSISDSISDQFLFRFNFSSIFQFSYRKDGIGHVPVI